MTLSSYVLDPVADIAVVGGARLGSSVAVDHLGNSVEVVHLPDTDVVARSVDNAVVARSVDNAVVVLLVDNAVVVVLLADNDVGVVNRLDNTVEEEVLADKVVGMDPLGDMVAVDGNTVLGTPHFAFVVLMATLVPDAYLGTDLDAASLVQESVGTALKHLVGGLKRTEAALLVLAGMAA
jgi:hypothetical protein